jgi:serine/threonine-protein kinase
MIAGRFRAEAKIAVGGMGEVWAGEHIGLGLKVAIKVLRASVAGGHEHVARFKREAFLLGKIRSERVARIVDYFVDDLYGPVLVMEFVEGVTLASLLESERLDAEQAVALGVELLRAVRDLHHARILHRDLKPGNIIVNRRDDGSLRLIIVDFGVSRFVSSPDDDEELTGITRTDMAVGTIEYMAPEQLVSSRDVTERADIYAVGAVLYRAVAAGHLFGALTNADLAYAKLTLDPPTLPVANSDRLALGLQAAIKRAVARRPEDRYALAEEMLADLELLQGGASHPELEAVRAQRKGVESIPRSYGARYRPYAIAAAIAMAVGAVGGKAASSHTWNPTLDKQHTNAPTAAPVATSAEQGVDLHVRFESPAPPELPAPQTSSARGSPDIRTCERPNNFKDTYVRRSAGEEPARAASARRRMLMIAIEHSVAEADLAPREPITMEDRAENLDSPGTHN